MKQYKYIIYILIIILLSVNSVYALGKNKKSKTEQPQAAVQQKEITHEQFTSDVHSIFSLKDCVDIAVRLNPEIRASVFNEEVYKSKIGQAWANYFPSISGGFEVSRSGTKYKGENFPSVYSSMYSTMGYVPNLSADMLLFDFGKTKATADSAKRTYEAKQADTMESINNIIYNIKSTYFNILFAQAQVKVYKDTVKDYELQLNQAKGFYRLGKKAKIDVVTAEYNLGKANVNLVKAENVLKVAKVQLSKIMGIPEYTNYELSDELSMKKYDTPVEEIIKVAFDVRPELISAQKSVEAAKMSLRAARRKYAPDLDVFANYGNGIGNNYDIESGQVGVGLEYTGMNIAKIKKQVDEAKATYKMTQAQLDDVKDALYYNVKKNYIDLETARETIIMAKLALDQAKEQYRQVTGRYKAGVGDAIELKDGENTYLNARLDFYNAMLNYNVSAAALEKEVGAPLVFSDENILNLTKEDL